MNFSDESEKDLVNIQIRYGFTSYWGPSDGDRYIQDIHARIVLTDDNGDDMELIGRGRLKLLLLSRAIDDGYDLREVFEEDEYVERIGNEIFDFERNGLREDLEKELFDNAFMENPNICILERMEILPSWRGMGIGAKFLKDRYHQFNSACGLFVMQPYPLQLEAAARTNRQDTFTQSMHLEQLEQNPEKAHRSLRAYYESIGYVSVPSSNLMFLLSGYINPRLEAIDLDEPITRLSKKRNVPGT